VITVLNRVAFSATLLVALGWFVSVGFSMNASIEPQKEYDGSWWLAITLDEQSAFLEGFGDCYTSEIHKRGRSAVHLSLNQDFVTNFYRSSTENKGFTLLTVLARSDNPAPLRSVAPGGEEWTDPHGFLDGQWWREEEPRGRLAFVEGYLYCHQKLANEHGGVFHKSAATYVVLVNRWYRLNENTDDVDPKRVGAKIATVLFKFRDAPQKLGGF
jgi:hypothetical protein